MPSDSCTFHRCEWRTTRQTKACITAQTSLPTLFNSEWCARTLGIAQLLAGDDMCIRFGPNGKQQLVVDATPIAMNAPQGIRDELVDEPDEMYTEWQENDGAHIDEIEPTEQMPDAE